MIYSHKTDSYRHNISAQEKAKLKKLLIAKSTAWMIEANPLV